MERASRIMYSIANFFTWIVAILAIAGIVISSLVMAGVLQNDVNLPLIGIGGIVYYVIILIVALITIALVRIAKDKKSSKGWDILFIILGVLHWNVFYILGGIFGLVAVRR